ncbi:hypothetical protein [Acinetobacter pollinis]|uniref:Uncharacterized protein n=1 Tax=Acinetobacter pollinis TaxID=2605270 RepID=A0ABU6DQ62_9GAMM|nr:hypothetical protein [Acinetobacter pollinis]MEB5475974.1 hypothetical protein [Acinetobacter pollinis]
MTDTNQSILGVDSATKLLSENLVTILLEYLKDDECTSSSGRGYQLLKRGPCHVVHAFQSLNNLIGTKKNKFEATVLDEKDLIKIEFKVADQKWVFDKSTYNSINVLAEAIQQVYIKPVLEGLIDDS